MVILILMEEHKQYFFAQNRLLKMNAYSYKHYLKVRYKIDFKNT